GEAGCISEIGQGQGEDDITEVTSALMGPNGHDYVFIQSPMKNWNDAQAFCAMSLFPQGTYHLATIHDDTENDWVFQHEQSSGGGNWWLGYTDAAAEGLWAWADGMGQAYVNWNNGEPNNQGNEDCLMHASQINGKWNDSNCGNAFKFVCENGAVDSQPATLTFGGANTNSDTQNYRQWAFDLNANQAVTLGTCGLPGASGVGDTYLRLMNTT